MSELDDFFAKHNWEILARINQWRVERDSENADLVRISLHAKDGETYVVRCECNNYPEEAPSVVFISGSGSKDDPAAWPDGNPEFGQIVKPPPASFLCTSITREGLAHHPDWKSDATKGPWNKNRHSLMDIFNFLQRLLNSSDYTGRKKS